jgi:MFS family permease
LSALAARARTPARVGRLVAAEGVSNFGSMLSRLAIPWLATLTLDATPMAMAVLLVADVVAAAVGALLLGAPIDRAPKRAVMLACDALRALVLAAVAWAAWQGAASLALLVVASATGGLLSIAFDLARSAWIAQRAAADDLPRRNAQLAMAGSVAETLAFAAGGWLYQALGAALALLVDALSYLGSALLVRGLPEAPSTASVARASEPAWVAWWREQREGWRVLLCDDALRAMAGIEALRALGFSLAGTSYMVYVSRDLALPTSVQGMVFALGSLGALAGASLAPRWGQRFGPGRAMAGGLGLAALGAACVPLSSFAGGAGAMAIVIALLAAHQVVGDAGATVHDVHDQTLRQTAVEATLLARVDAGIRGVGQGATLIGAVLGGVLGTALSARWVLVASAAALGLAAWRTARTLARRPR